MKKILLFGLLLFTLTTCKKAPLDEFLFLVRVDKVEVIDKYTMATRLKQSPNSTLYKALPNKKIKLMIAYPMTTGRNFDEVLRVLDSIQLSAKHSVATPANWKPGDDVIIPTSVSDEQAKQKYPGGFKTLKPYLRTVAQPK